MEVIIQVAKVLGYAVIGYFMSTIIHELGHVVCGLINRWKFYMLVVGPFKLYREDNDLNKGIKFGIEKNPALWGGCGGTFPARVDENITKVFARILIAGPAASILLGIISIVLFIFTGSDLVAMIGMIAFGEGIACALPMNIKTGILYNDGTRFKRIIKGGKEAEEERAIITLVINEALYGEDNIYQKELIDVLTDSDDASFRYYGYYYLYQLALSEGNEIEKKKIRQEAEKIKDRVSKYVVSSCVME